MHSTSVLDFVSVYWNFFFRELKYRSMHQKLGMVQNIVINFDP
jgi:hypothetical protein